MWIRSQTTLIIFQRLWWQLMIKEGHTDRNECQNAERLSSIRRTSDKQCWTSVESADRFYLENILKNNTRHVYWMCTQGTC